MRRLADLASDVPVVHLWLARFALVAGDTDTAKKAIRDIVATSPAGASKHYRRAAALYLELHELDAAEICLERAKGAHPTTPRVWMLYGELYRHGAKTHEAARCYEQAFRFAADRVQAILALEGLADCCADSGCKDEAIAVCQRMIGFAPTDPSGYRLLVSCSEGSGISDQAITTMLDMLASGSLCDCRRMGLHYSLGKVYDRRGSYGQAFAHFLIANGESARLAGTFDVESLRKLVDSQIGVFSSEFISEMSRHGCQDDFLICIIGMPRSGTTLIEQILSSHPEVTGLGERRDFHLLADGLQAKLKSRNPYPHCCTDLPKHRVSEIAHSVQAELRKTAGSSPRVVTKLPGDSFQLGLIKILFPRARFVHCIRHPIDTCLSCYMQNFTNVLYSTDLADLAAVYRLYRRMMDHWQVALPAGSLFECGYEQTVTEPDAVIRGLHEHCGICFNQDWSRFPDRARRVITASKWQVRHPLYQSSVQRWKNYTPFLGPLLELGERHEELGQAQKLERPRGSRSQRTR
jgi:hypothetical protein